jgi:hypothetical protein
MNLDPSSKLMKTISQTKSWQPAEPDDVSTQHHQALAKALALDVRFGRATVVGVPGARRWPSSD